MCSFSNGGKNSASLPIQLYYFVVVVLFRLTGLFRAVMAATASYGRRARVGLSRTKGLFMIFTLLNLACAVSSLIDEDQQVKISSFVRWNNETIALSNGKCVKL